MNAREVSFFLPSEVTEERTDEGDVGQKVLAVAAAAAALLLAVVVPGPGLPGPPSSTAAAAAGNSRDAETPPRPGMFHEQNEFNIYLELMQHSKKHGDTDRK